MAEFTQSNPRSGCSERAARILPDLGISEGLQQGGGQGLTLLLRLEPGFVAAALSLLMHRCLQGPFMRHSSETQIPLPWSEGYWQVKYRGWVKGRQELRAALFFLQSPRFFIQLLRCL